MNENDEDFVPDFGGKQPDSVPSQPDGEPSESLPATPSAPASRVHPDQEATKEHQPTSALPLSETAPIARLEQPFSPPSGKSQRRAQPVPILLVFLVGIFLCLISSFLIVVSGVLNQTLPASFTSLADFLTPQGAGTATASATVTRTPIGQAVASGGAKTSTPTPALAVTVFPTVGVSSPSVTPTRTPLASPTKIPATFPPVPSPIPTLSAPTLTPETFQPAHEVTRAGIVMVSIPGGTFNMGSDAVDTEKPIHPVTLSAYYIDKFEVTNASWAACVATGACSPPGSTDGYDGQPYYGVDALNSYPVIFVSWFNADAYCHWRDARLPTEAEWEMAARWNPSTGAVTTYPWGDDWNPANLNYCDSSCLNTDPRFKDTSYNDNWPQMAPVGSFTADVSPSGVVDMGGNIAEWVADWYGPAYYASSPAVNPPGPASGVDKVIRGGGWSLNQLWSRSTARNHFGPLTQAAGVGFRCAANP